MSDCLEKLYKAKLYSTLALLVFPVKESSPTLLVALFHPEGNCSGMKGLMNLFSSITFIKTSTTTPQDGIDNF